MNYQKIGNVLTVMGLLAWLPFFYLLLTGAEPSIYPFLIVHLSGVIGGTRLRAYGKDEQNEKPRRLIVGRILIILGVLAWIPYIYQKDILGQSLEIGPYLAAHLTGVLGGIALLLSVPLARVWQQSRQESV